MGPALETSLIRVIQAEWTPDPNSKSWEWSFQGELYRNQWIGIWSWSSKRVIDPRWVKSLIRVIHAEWAYDPDHPREWSIQGELNH